MLADEHADVRATGNLCHQQARWLNFLGLLTSLVPTWKQVRVLWGKGAAVENMLLPGGPMGKSAVHFRD